MLNFSIKNVNITNTNFMGTQSYYLVCFILLKFHKLYGVINYDIINKIYTKLRKKYFEKFKIN